jgi:hypothetical protein
MVPVSILAIWLGGSVKNGTMDVVALKSEVRSLLAFIGVVFRGTLGWRPPPLGYKKPCPCVCSVWDSAVRTHNQLFLGIPEFPLLRGAPRVESAVCDLGFMGGEATEIVVENPLLRSEP